MTSADDAVSLALAFYQAPAHYHDLPHGRVPLPAGVDKLLRLAAGASPEELGLETDGLVRKESMAKAAHFFIEQVLLAHEADYYRMLGVYPGASLELIKEHHRLLMRLFHPDRESNSSDEQKAAAYASRINLAYNTLRQAHSRAAYDTVLRQSRKPATPQPHQRPAYRRPKRPPTGIWQSMPPTLVRNLPQFVLGGVALIATVGVATVYLDRPSMGASSWKQGVKAPRGARAASTEQVVKLTQAKEAALAHESKPQISAFAAPLLAVPSSPASADPPPAPLSAQQAAEATPSEPATSVLAVGTSSGARMQSTATAQERRPAGIAVPVDSRHMAAPTAQPSLAEAPPAPAAVQSVAMRNPLAPATPPAVALPAPAQPPAAAEAATFSIVAAASPPSPALPETDLARLISRISTHYANGDLENFMALFDDSARSGDGSKAQIRNDYENLFQNTSQRDIIIWNMNWHQHGDTTKGEGDFQARVLRNGETATRTYTGQISIEVVKRGNSPLIKTFKHTVKR